MTRDDAARDAACVGTPPAATPDARGAPPATPDARNAPPATPNARAAPPAAASAARENAATIARRLRDAGHRALFNGGCVRDLLLGRAPHDYDIATSARPADVRHLFPGALEVGAQFGVMIVDGVEVATFRSDGEYSDGRHPENVAYADDPETDAQRRDFTINGMFLDPESGEVFDFVGGRADIAAGIIRAIGDPARRFAEDKLRLLRAVRFAARFGFAIAPATYAAIRAAHKNISEVSSERIREELTKMLTEGHPRRAFELLEATGLLAEVLPEVAATRGVEQPPQYHPEGDVWIHTRMMLDTLQSPSPTLAWGVLLHDIGKPPTFTAPRDANDRIRFNNHAAVGARMAEAICARLKFSRRDTDNIVALVEDHMRFGDVEKMRDSTLKRFLRADNFAELLELHRADCLSSHGDLSLHNFVQTKLREIPAEQISPPALINGHDLIAMGYQPGPEFSAMLRAAEDAQLEGQIHTPTDAREWMRAHYSLVR